MKKPKVKGTATTAMSYLHQLLQIQDIQSTARLLESLYQQFVWTHSVAEILIFGLPLLLTVKLVSALLIQIKVRKQLAAADQQLQQYALLVETLADMKERNRIAHAVHDALGHKFAAQNIQLQAAVKLWQSDPDKAKPFVEQAQQLAVEAIQEIRRSLQALQADVREDQAIETSTGEHVGD